MYDVELLSRLMNHTLNADQSGRVRGLVNEGMFFGGAPQMAMQHKCAVSGTTVVQLSMPVAPLMDPWAAELKSFVCM